MILTVKRSVAKGLEDVGRLLAEAAKSPEHERDADLIADFIDRVLLVEMKTALESGAVMTEEIELPDTLLEERIKERVDKAVKETAAGFAAPASADVPAPAAVRTTSPAVLEERTPLPGAETVVDGRRVNPEGRKAYPKRTGNGHKSRKVRDLGGSEKDAIREHFMAMNGMFADDDLVCWKKVNIPDEISNLQVAGFVGYLHTEVAEGRTELPDLEKYEKWMSSKYDGLHREAWARYTNPLYVECRRKNAEARERGLPATSRVRK